MKRGPGVRSSNRCLELEPWILNVWHAPGQANQADLKGEGKLEMEGVRPQRYAAGTHPFGAPDSAGEPLRPTNRSEASTGVTAVCKHHQSLVGA